MPSQRVSRRPQTQGATRVTAKPHAAPAHGALPVIPAQVIDNPEAARPVDILALQHQVGNTAVQRMLAGPPFQPMLHVAQQIGSARPPVLQRKNNPPETKKDKPPSGSSSNTPTTGGSKPAATGELALPKWRSALAVHKCDSTTYQRGKAESALTVNSGKTLKVLDKKSDGWQLCEFPNGALYYAWSNDISVFQAIGRATPRRKFLRWTIRLYDYMVGKNIVKDSALATAAVGSHFDVYGHYAPADEPEYILGQVSGTFGFARLDQIILTGQGAKLANAPKEKGPEPGEKAAKFFESTSKFTGTLGDVGTGGGDIAGASGDFTGKLSDLPQTPGAKETSGYLGAGSIGLGSVSAGLGGVTKLIEMCLAVRDFKKTYNDNDLVEMLKSGADVVGSGSSAVLQTGQVLTGGSATLTQALLGEAGKAATGVLSGLGKGLDAIKGFVGFWVNGIKTVVSAVKVVQAWTKSKSGGEAIADLAANALATVQGVLDTAKGTIDGARAILDGFSLFSAVTAVMGIVTACISLVTTLINTFAESINLLKRGVQWLVSVIVQRRLKKAGSAKESREELKVRKELASISRKRKRRSTGAVVQSLTVIGGNLLSAVMSLGSISFTIAGLASSWTGVGAVLGAGASMALNIASSITTLAASLGTKLAGVGVSAYRGGRQWLINVTAGSSKAWLRSLAPESWREKTTEKKTERRANHAKVLLNMVAELPPYNKNVRQRYDTVLFYLKATGVDMEDLFAKNGQPAEQAQMLMKAMKQRE